MPTCLRPPLSTGCLEARLPSPSMMRTWVRPIPLVMLVVAGSLTASVPSSAVTEAQVDEACAEYREAKDILDAAIAERDAAQAEYAAIYADRELASDRADRLVEQIAERQEELEELREGVVEWAVEAYMAAGTEISGLVLRTRSLDELITAQEFLKVITNEKVAAVDRLRVIVWETETMQNDLDDQTTHLLVLEAEAHRLSLVLAGATDDALNAARQLKGECQRLYQQRQAELARARALEAARRSGGAGGVAASLTPGFVCPMNPGATSFINDWGFPRSGGRTHKGNDIFAPKRQAVIAVSAGSITLTRGGLGGIGIWLSANNGVDYYYAHLDGYASGVRDGVYVNRGQVIAYNGNTGNAYGGAPHVHFQLHPGGRTRAPVNPYPTLVRACR